MSEVELDKMLELEVMPERGLTNGQLELVLGMPLVTCIEMLKNNYTTVKSVHLSYSDQTPLDVQIVLELTDNGIKLIFDQKCQRLQIIEICDPKRVKLKYCNNVFSAPGIAPTLELIRQCFGPTRAGDHNVQQQLFLLLFRGILFVFPLWSTGTNNSPIFDADGFDFSEPSMEGTLVLSNLRIFNGSDPLNTIVPSLPNEYMDNRCFAEFIEGKPNTNTGTITDLRIKLLQPNDDISVNHSDVTYCDRQVSFGDTPQDILSKIGSPDKIFYKEEDKMRIHTQHKMPSSKAADYFYNYFSLGLDILFDGLCHQVKKFILHTNFPGHYNFSNYHRCHFSLSFSNKSDTTSDDSHIITTFTKWSDIADSLTQGKLEKPVVLSRSSSTNNTNPFGYTYCYNYSNVILEVMKNSHIASVIIYNS